MTIKYDKSPVSIVITCTACPWWSAFAFTRAEADTTANGHEARQHPGDLRRRNANSLARKRRAARS